MNVTDHAEKRLQQRALRQEDATLILTVGTHLDSDRVMLTGKDVEREVQRRKREIERLERCRDFVVVACGGQVITAFRPYAQSSERKLARVRRLVKA